MGYSYKYKYRYKTDTNTDANTDTSTHTSTLVNAAMGIQISVRRKGASQGGIEREGGLVGELKPA